MTGDPNALRRAFVTVGSRQVHYRRAGAGPAAVLLHESPRSSASMSWLIRPLARRFCVLAFDTPGYGSSTRFEAESPAIADYAHTLAGALDALGVEQCGVYGVHTGAAIALELARRDPQRVTCAVLDGLPLYSDDESSELLEHYAPTFAPRIDGAHLAALWTCYRDRFLFSPWYRRERLTRRDVAMPEPDALHEGVMDMLRSGNGYGAGYAAAFRFRAVPAIADLTVPTTILEHEGDLLAGQVDRLGELPESASVLRLPTDRKQSADVIGGLLAAHAPRCLRAARAPHGRRRRNRLA